MSSVSENVQNIIEKRKERLQKIEACEAHILHVDQALDSLDHELALMINEKGQVLRDSPYADFLSENPGMPGMLLGINTQPCHLALANAKAKLEIYKKRSARDGVYLSVIGIARSGKSAVLQAFSGLNNSFIPSSSGADCTGATSVIHNVIGSHGKVILTFKRREEMVSLAQRYLDEMIEDPLKRIRLRPGVLEDIRDLKDTLLTNGKLVSLMEQGSSKGIYMDKLSAMVLNYDEWACYAGMDGTKELSDEREIVSFVAQMDEEGHRYYKYLVVNTCDIECEFPEKNVGKIRLIDTIGLGDNAMGISDSMLKTVREESDAVIMVIKPNSGTGSGVSSDIVNSLYKPIYDSCKDRNLDDWLFYFINHVSRTVEKNGCAVAQNTSLCEMALATIKNCGWMGHEPCIVDAMNKTQTQAFLNMVLTSLLGKLDRIDEVFRREAEKALEETRLLYNMLASQIDQIAKENATANTQVSQRIIDLRENALSQTIAILRGLSAEWREKRREPCPTVFNSSIIVLNRMMYGTYIPSIETIEDQLRRYQIIEVTRRYMNQIRTRVKNDFLSVNGVLDSYIDRMKDAVGTTLSRDLALNRLYPVPERQAPRAWMRELADEKFENYPQIRMAMQTLCDFTISVKGFLNYEVREALEMLDPDLHPIEGVQMFKNGMPDHKRIAMNIYDELDRRLVLASKRLNASIREMCTQPNRCISAEVGDFTDRLLYADGVMLEWEKFYTGEAGVLWADEIAAYQKNSVIGNRWQAVIREIRRNMNHSKFTIEE